MLSDWELRAEHKALKTVAWASLIANAVLAEVKKDPKEEVKNIPCQSCNRKGAWCPQLLLTTG